MKSQAAASGLATVGRGADASLLPADHIPLLPIEASLIGGAGGRPLSKYATEWPESELSVSLLSDRLPRHSMHNLACFAVLMWHVTSRAGLLCQQIVLKDLIPR